MQLGWVGYCPGMVGSHITVPLHVWDCVGMVGYMDRPGVGSSMVFSVAAKSC